MSKSIDDLLNALQNPNKSSDHAQLNNDFRTWARIGNKDKFEELGLEPSELESFLEQWIKDNPYNNI